MSNYLIEYLSEPIESIVDEILSISGIPLNELKVRDLVYDGENPICSGNGVYVFKTSERIYYVGNCTSRCFVERIPAHFDIRKAGWFNSLLKAILKDKYGKAEVTDLRLQEAATIAFNDLRLVLINFQHYDKIAINNLECNLGKLLKPINNRFRRLQPEL